LRLEPVLGGIKFIVYGIPTAKGRPRFFWMRNGATCAFTPKKTAGYESNVLSQALSHKPEKPLESPLGVMLLFCMPIPKGMRKADLANALQEHLPMKKKPDLDNLIKSILDPLNGVFWKDDSQVCAITALKVYSDKPRVEVTIDELPLLLPRN
jgi:Holliday junction resolvase RusA-like endonuclease